MSVNGEACEARLEADANWFVRVLLHFKPFEYHISQDGFVLYKRFKTTLYIYASGHFVFDTDGMKKWDGGYSKTWSN